METPLVMHSVLRQPLFSPSTSFRVSDYRNGADDNFQEHFFPEFFGGGCFLFIVHLPLQDSTRTENEGREPIHKNTLKGILVDSAGTTRTGTDYGVFPPSITYECLSHTHTAEDGRTIQGLSTSSGFGPDESAVGGTRRTQSPQQAFFLVNARPGDRLYFFRDYAPYTALQYEAIRLAPDTMRFFVVEI